MHAICQSSAVATHFTEIALRTRIIAVHDTNFLHHRGSIACVIDKKMSNCCVERIFSWTMHRYALIVRDRFPSSARLLACQQGSIPALPESPDRKT